MNIYLVSVICAVSILSVAINIWVHNYRKRKEREEAWERMDRDLPPPQHFVSDPPENWYKPQPKKGR